MKNFRDLINDNGIHVFDGAVGTRFYDKGVYINRSYDELNLTAPELVREVHEEYVRAGAEIIETNSYGASRHKLQQYSLENKLKEINAAAARIERRRKSAQHGQQAEKTPGLRRQTRAKQAQRTRKMHGFADHRRPQHH